MAGPDSHRPDSKIIAEAERQAAAEAGHPQAYASAAQKLDRAA
jgi:hypothetical protein